MTFVPIQVGDNLLAALNAMGADLQGQFDQLNGANLVLGSVQNSALAAGRSVYAVSMTSGWTDALTTSDVTGAFSYKLPNINGVVNTSWQYIGSSVAFKTVTTPLGVGARMDMVLPGGTHQVTVDSTVISAAATPYEANSVAPIAASSGDTMKVNFVHSASGNVAGITVVHFWTVALTSG